ncbi:MAG: DUF4351 domain-containing protein [Magnetococcales bacterium]|nr:DUF4351 domain-containing protein [Magnetococcales bacterium]
MDAAPDKTCWHCLAGELLKELLTPVGIEVALEVPVMANPPKADLILLRKHDLYWNRKQTALLADGLRDLESEHILIELKVTENLSEEALSQISVYDTLYLKSKRLKRSQLHSVLVASQTPRPEFLTRFSFESLPVKGVYESKPTWGGRIRLILLNELANTSHNAFLKCFASRKPERIAAFETINQSGLLHRSDVLDRILLGLWRRLMKGSLNTPETDHVAMGELARLGQELLDSAIDSMSEEKLFSLPRVGQRVHEKIREGHREGHREGEAEMLKRLLRRRFGDLPSWAVEKIATADEPLLEAWVFRVLDARTLEEVFSEEI